MNLYDNLVSARRELSVFQHHDGVTGTAKDEVMKDYGQRYANSSADRTLAYGGDRFEVKGFLGRGSSASRQSFERFPKYILPNLKKTNPGIIKKEFFWKTGKRTANIKIFAKK